jgi:aryl-alcohol dehydrogenase-like predicted oxidoreductase
MNGHVTSRQDLAAPDVGRPERGQLEEGRRVPVAERDEQRERDGHNEEEADRPRQPPAERQAIGPRCSARLGEAGSYFAGAPGAQRSALELMRARRVLTRSRHLTTEVAMQPGPIEQPSVERRPVESSGTFPLGSLLVHRLGYGAMRLTGDGVWGPPRDRGEAIRVLRRAVDLGVDLIDTADSYGPYVSEELICEALHPYPRGLVIATKAGLVRTGPGMGPEQWIPVGRPEYLRQECEMSLRRLRLERIDLFQLHRVDPKVPRDEQFGLLRDLQREGKIRHAGLSEVTVDDVVAAERVLPIVSVQNLYNLVDRHAEPLLRYCEGRAIGFIPWFPIAAGDLAGPGGVVGEIARATGRAPAQIALAWLLRRSPVMLPIPGSSKVAHMEDNCAAATLKLTDEQAARLDAAVPAAVA